MGSNSGCVAQHDQSPDGGLQILGMEQRTSQLVPIGCVWVYDRGGYSYGGLENEVADPGLYADGVLDVGWKGRGWHSAKDGAGGGGGGV